MTLTTKKYLCGALVASVPFASLLWGQDSETEEEFFELSPFVVTASEDDGYVANSTLAGTRLKTSLADVGASITAVTESFLEDTGSTNVNELLLYTANTETATAGGNFSGGFEQSDAFGRGFQSGAASISNPQTAQRVRGLASADLARNLFATEIPWDDYIVDRVEIVRGANSILFGQGSPAGIINANIISPTFKDANELKVRFDDQGSLRSSFDVNRVLMEDKLAVRFAGLYDHYKYRQDPAYENDERIFGAVNWKINDRFAFRASSERGIIRANRANPFGPTDGFSDYLNEVGTTTYPVILPEDPTVIPELFGQTDVLPASIPRIFVQYGLNLEADGSLAGSNPSETSTRWTLNTSNIVEGNEAGVERESRAIRVSRPYYELARGIGLLPRSLSDYSIFDWKNNALSGEFPYQDQDFETFQAVLEYTSENQRYGAELTFDYQKSDSEQQVGPTSSRDYLIRVDVAEQTLDGNDSPNTLRPVMHLTQNINSRNVGGSVYDTIQFNAFARFDFEEDANMDGWLGRLLGDHTLTFYGSTRDVESDGISFDETWVGPGIENNASNGLTPNRAFGHNHRDVGSSIYLGPAITSIDDISITPLGFSARDYFPNGATYDLRVWDKAAQNFLTVPHQSIHNTQSISDEITSTDTMALTLQSRLWDDRVITTVGYREDDVTNTRKIFQTAPNTANMVDPNLFTTDEVGGTGDYLSWSVVAKQPENWDLPLDTRFSVFYSESENFDPSATGRLDALARPLAPPTGTTEDYGIRINTFNEKLELKFNFFETSLAGQGVSGGLLGVAITEIDLRFRELTLVQGIDAGYLDPNDNILSTFGDPPQAVLDESNATLTPEGIYTFSGRGRITDTSDVTAEGMEIEAVFNPTDNWTFVFNASRQETIRNNSYQGLQDYIDLRLPSWQTAFDYPRGLVDSAILAEPGMVDENGFLNLSTFAAAYPNNTVGGDYDTRLRIPLQAILDQDGGVVTEQREWRFNMITNYTFADDSRLNGMNIGGAVRWQDEAALGNPFTTNADGQTIVDVNNPFFGSSETYYDLWVGYSKPIMNDRVGWKVQLNIRNLFADDDPIPVTIDAFGEAAQLRLPPLTTWAVTNTFKF